MSYKLIDESSGRHGQTDILDRVYEQRPAPAAGALKVRVRVHRNSYADQSFAVAEVLTPALTWTDIASEPSGNWHAGSKPADVAGRLIARAAAILS